MTAKEIDTLSQAFISLFKIQDLEVASFMLGVLHKTNSIKLSYLFSQVANYYSKPKSNLDNVKQTFIQLKNMGLVSLNMKVEDAYVNLSNLGKQIVHLITQKIMQRNSLN